MTSLDAYTLILSAVIEFSDTVAMIAIIVGSIVLLICIDFKVREWNLKNVRVPTLELKGAQEKPEETKENIVDSYFVEQQPDQIPFDLADAKTFAVTSNKATIEILCILGGISPDSYLWDDLYKEDELLEQLWPWICLLKRPTLKP